MPVDVSEVEDELLQGGAVGDPLGKASIDINASEPQNLELREVSAYTGGEAAGERPAREVEHPNFAGIITCNTRVAAVGRGRRQVPPGDGAARKGLFHESEEMGVAGEVGLRREREEGEEEEEEKGHVCDCSGRGQGRRRGLQGRYGKNTRRAGVQVEWREREAFVFYTH